MLSEKAWTILLYVYWKQNIWNFLNDIMKQMSFSTNINVQVDTHTHTWFAVTHHLISFFLSSLSYACVWNFHVMRQETGWQGNKLWRLTWRGECWDLCHSAPCGLRHCSDCAGTWWPDSFCMTVKVLMPLSMNDNDTIINNHIELVWCSRFFADNNEKLWWGCVFRKVRLTLRWKIAFMLILKLIFWK